MIPEKYPVLKETVRIKKMKAFCWVSELFSDSGTAASPGECFILSLCNGQYQTSEIKDIYAGTFELDEHTAQQRTTDTLKRLKACINFEDTPRTIKQRYTPESFLYHTEKQENNPRGRFDTPAEAVLTLTKRCNFRCIYCYNSSGINNNKELQTDQWLEAVRQMKELDVVKCTITGGEPLVHPGFFKILTALVENDIMPYICTNGSLLDSQAIIKLEELKIPLVQISLDSSSPAEHDTLTYSRNSFPIIIRAIKELVKLGIKVYVKSVILPQNLETTGNLIELCHSLGVSNLVLDQYDLSYGGRGGNYFFLSQAQTKRLEDIVNDKKQKIHDMNINLISGSRNWKCKDDIVMCGALIQSFVIMPDGEYAVCEKLENIPEMSVGNFKTMPIREMWNSNRVYQITQPPKEHYAEPCRSCEHLDSCGSGCYAAKLLMTDELYGPDPKCWRADYQNNPFIDELRR
ncbi:MAG: radical SAM protein [Lachnospiraceae bacterium]|nr:radical SAM protein [Lachnospiraceae bacterium]